MARCLFVVSLFTAFILILPVEVTAEDAVGSCIQLPENIVVAPGYRAWIVDLIARSPTLRRQCAAIARSAEVRVSLDSTRRMIGHDRARTQFTRDTAGTLWATITIPMTREFAELLAHELEHVVEQIEGVNLKRMALVRDSGVREVARNVFETSRALAAGRAAAGEARTCAVPGDACGTRAVVMMAAKD